MNSPSPQPRRLPGWLFPTWAQRKKIFRRDAWILIIGAYVAIPAAFLLPANFRNESTAFVVLAWTAFMVRTFVFHIGLALLFFSLVAAAFRMWRAVAFAVPLLVFTLGPALWQYRPPGPPPVVKGETLRVMSVNVLAFNHATRPIVGEVLTQNPDLLLIQEYTPEWHSVIAPAVATQLPSACVVPETDCFGLAMYSRRAFETAVEANLPLGVADNPQMRAVIKLNGRDIAIYNVHLFPPSSPGYVKEQRRGFADLLDRLRSEALPALVVGDFNFTNDSPMAAALRELGYRDAHDLAGYGRGSTWPNIRGLRWLPGVRIDHVYLSPQLTAVESCTGDGDGSDHRPILATIGFRE